MDSTNAEPSFKQMSDDEFREKLKEIQAHAHALRDKEISLASQLLGDGALYVHHFFFLPSIERSVRLIDGELAVLELRNLPCAEILLRAQIDTCIRIYAAYIAEDREKLYETFMRQKPIKTLKDKEKHRLTDNYLKKRLSEYDPSLSEYYDVASGSIHYSARSLFLMSASTVDEKSYDICMNIGGTPDIHWNAPLIGCWNAFAHFTSLHIELLEKTLLETNTPPTNKAVEN